MTARSLYIIVLVMAIGGCSTDDAVAPKEMLPTTITGKVRSAAGGAVHNAKVYLAAATDVDPVFTDLNGGFVLTGFPAVQHMLKVEKIGFDPFVTPVPLSLNSTVTIDPVLQPRTYDIAAVKPLSSGPVRIRGKLLETDFDRNGTYEPFVVKGVSFSPAPIGEKPWTKAVYDRSIIWLQGLNASTVRTYSGADKYFLQKAETAGIRVIVSFWVGVELDLSLEEVRRKVVDDFATMVSDLKGYPAVLMWNLGNEQNLSPSPNNGNSPYWYSLAQEMAVAAYNVEGAAYHPVCISNGNLTNIGSASKSAADSSLTYVDLWASNAYERDFTGFFTEYRTRTAKPIVITEFGIDALNNVSKSEHEAVQAYFDSTNWMQIRTAADVCVGGTVFEFTDEWWKAGDPYSHDDGGYATGAHPDGFSNEEWWGIIAVTPDSDLDGMDEWRARKAYEMFKRNWQ